MKKRWKLAKKKKKKKRVRERSDVRKGNKR